MRGRTQGSYWMSSSDIGRQPDAIQSSAIGTVRREPRESIALILANSMPTQALVQMGARHAGLARRLRHVAVRAGEQPLQVMSLEFVNETGARLGIGATQQGR